jgi:hypothetical protein
VRRRYFWPLAAFALLSARADAADPTTKYQLLSNCITDGIPSRVVDAMATQLVDSGDIDMAATDEALMERVVRDCARQVRAGQQAAELLWLHLVLQHTRNMVLERLEIAPEQRERFLGVLRPIADQMELGANSFQGPRVTDDQRAQARAALAAAGFEMDVSDMWLTGSITSLASERLLRPRIEAMLASDQ